MPVLKQVVNKEIKLFILPDAPAFERWEQAGIEGYYTVPTNYPERIEPKPDIVIFINPFKHCVHTEEYREVHERITRCEVLFKKVMVL